MAHGHVRPLRRVHRRVVVAVFPAVGGPLQSTSGRDGFQRGPTNAGRYVIASCGTHSSTRYASLSRIRWGSEIKLEGTEYFVKHQGRWRRMSELTDETPEQLIKYAADLGWEGGMPGFWVFNDFGHLTCYYFKDRNRNGKLDNREKLEGEMIHTTPPDEAATAAGKKVKLKESHGCVHVKPEDIDSMKRSGYLRSGVSFVVHSYDELAPAIPQEAGSAPFEVHFYPGSKSILVYGRT